MIIALHGIVVDVSILGPLIIIKTFELWLFAYKSLFKAYCEINEILFMIMVFPLFILGFVAIPALTLLFQAGAILFYTYLGVETAVIAY